MQHTRHCGFVSCLWPTTGVWQWQRLSVWLLALVLSGCATGAQDLSRHNDPGLADAERARAAARTPAEEFKALDNLGDAYRHRGQPRKAIALYKQALAIIREVIQRRHEEFVLNKLGIAHADLSEYRDALSYYEQALASAQQEHNRRLEGAVLNNLGHVYRVLGQSTKALAFYERALALAREEHDRSLEGTTLNNLGNAYLSFGQSAKAITYHEQALTIARALQNRAKEGRALSNLGEDYRAVSRYEQALAFHEQALASAREVHNRSVERFALSELGLVYGSLGRYERALAFHEQALARAREEHNRAGEGVSLKNLGRAYAGLHQYQQALTSHEQALAIAREVGHRFSEGHALAHRGLAYHGLHQDEQALASLTQALTIQRETGDRRNEAFTVHYLGRVYAALGQYDQARSASEQALALMREAGSRTGEGEVFGQLMRLWNAQHQPHLAIFYGKQAINRLQEVRGSLEPLAQELQEGFLTAKAPIYRKLAEVLLAEGRLLEAQQVLDLLKAEEYLDFLRRDATAATALQGRATLTPEEATWAERYAAIADRVAALGAERGTLRVLPTWSAAEEARLAQLEADLTAANWAFQRFLTDLQTELGRTPLAQEKLFSLRETQGLMADLRDLGPGTVALYTLVGATTAHVLLITPDVQLVREVPITAADLSRKVLAFREALEAARHQHFPPDPRPLAQELYALLVAPVAAELRAVQARTLLWSLDGVLRYVPLAALYDGERYLIERYALVVFTPASQPRWKDLPQPQWRALGLGVSKAHAPLSALPGVVSELRGIIRDPTQGATDGVLPGTIQLDEAFTAQEMRADLRQGYPVVHIASHFQLQPGDETASFLLLGDGSHLSLAQVKTWPTVFGGVDLLTLSACNTAAGGAETDGKEVEGFGVLAQRQGAKAVLATLWPVEDSSTKELMQTFYRLRATQAGLSKAEALRQAQLRLLTGPGPLMSASSAPERGLASRPESPQEPTAPLTRFVPPPQAPYAHPYYWAPFVLMGNWK